VLVLFRDAFQMVLIMVFSLWLMLVEQMDNLAIRPKAKYDRSSLQLSQLSLNATVHPALAPVAEPNEVSAPANKNYNRTL